MCGFKPLGFVLRPFYFGLQTLPNLRHAVTIFALGMRLRSRRRRGVKQWNTNVFNAASSSFKPHHVLELKVEVIVQWVPKTNHNSINKI